MNRALLTFRILVLGLATVAPFLRPHVDAPPASHELGAFPTSIDGRLLTPASFSDVEAPWLARFPGRIGRFTDGERLWILRMTALPTLELHSSARCLRAAGWHVEAASAHRDSQRRIWSTFIASKGERRLSVREQVQSTSTQASWPDIDAWRWDAWLGRDPGPWCAYTSIEVLR